MQGLAAPAPPRRKRSGATAARSQSIPHEQQVGYIADAVNVHVGTRWREVTAAKPQVRPDHEQVRHIHAVIAVQIAWDAGPEDIDRTDEGVVRLVSLRNTVESVYL